MKFNFLVFGFILLRSIAFGQGTWEYKWTIPTDSSYVWDVDPARNTYLIQGSRIQKFTALATLQQEQSNKSIGTIQKIDAKNGLKIAVFSEDQQRICFLDNALAPQGPCIELIDQGVQLAQTFVYSNQIDRVWVYDEINAELKLITTQNSQAQLIQNIRDLVNIQELQALFEFNNELYLVDITGMVIRLDNFGSLIASVQLPIVPINGLQITDNGYLYTDSTHIQFLPFDSNESMLFFEASALPVNQIQSFKWVGNFLFIGTTSGIMCYEFLQNEK